MKIFAVIIVAGLVGGGAVTGMLVGNVDWQAYFSDENHHIGYKYNSQDQIYSVIHTDPEEGEDGNYYAVTRYQIENTRGSLVLENFNSNYNLESNPVDNGYVFSYHDGSVTIPGAHLELRNNNSYNFKTNNDFYVISETNKLEIQHKESTVESCLDSIYSAERFFNYVSEHGQLYLAGGLEYWSLDVWEKNVEKFGQLYKRDNTQYTRMEEMLSKGWIKPYYYTVGGVQTANYNPGYYGCVMDNKKNLRLEDRETAHFSVNRYEGRNLTDVCLILVEDGSFDAEKIRDGYLFTGQRGALYVPHAQYHQQDDKHYYLLSNTNYLDTTVATEDYDDLRPMMKCVQRFIERYEGKQLKFVDNSKPLNLSIDYDVQRLNPGYIDLSSFNYEDNVKRHLEDYYAEDYTNRVNWSEMNANYGLRNGVYVNHLAKEISRDGHVVLVMRYHARDIGDCTLVLRNSENLKATPIGEGYLFTYMNNSIFLPYVTYDGVNDYYILTNGSMLEFPIIGDSGQATEHMGRMAAQFFDQMPNNQLVFLT